MVVSIDTGLNSYKKSLMSCIKYYISNCVHGDDPYYAHGKVNISVAIHSMYKYVENCGKLNNK